MHTPQILACMCYIEWKVKALSGKFGCKSQISSFISVSHKQTSNLPRVKFRYLQKCDCDSWPSFSRCKKKSGKPTLSPFKTWRHSSWDLFSVVINALDKSALLFCYTKEV